MNGEDIVACGLSWQSTADPDAGTELLRGLQSADPNLKLLAEVLLAENGEESMRLLEEAIAAGWLSPHLAGPCMAEILRRQVRGEASTMVT